MKQLLIVSGSPALDSTPESLEWTKATILQSLASHGLQNGDAIIFGGGPGAIAKNDFIPWPLLAIEKKIKTIDLRKNGERWEDGFTKKVWHASPPSTSSELSQARSTAILQYASKAKEAGWNVRLLSLETKEPSAETSYLVLHAESSGIQILEVTFTPPEARPDVVWVDLETGGRSQNLHPILQIGAIHTDPSSRKLLRKFETKVFPEHGLTIDPAAAEICGYNRREWATAPSVSKAMEDFLVWLPQTKFRLAGYNVSFDKRFLSATCERIRKPTPNWKEDYSLDPMSTIKSALTSKRIIPNYKLDTACAHFGLPNEVRHRALEDAERARLVYLYLLGKRPESSIFATGRFAVK